MKDGGNARSTRNRANPWIKINKTSSYQQITKKNWGYFWWGNFELGRKTTKSSQKTNINLDGIHAMLFDFSLLIFCYQLFGIHVLALFGQVTIFFGILKYLCTALNLQLLINVVVICAAFQLCCLDRYLVIVWVYLLYVILIFANDDVSFANQSLVFLRII